MAHKLLLADDSVTIQRVIELTFADEDVEVTAVGDGRQAIERIRAERPDIVLADVGMPERDGYEVSAFVKGDPGLAQIPVLLLTGAFEPIDETRARAVGCDGVLVKPFEPQMVISRVKDLLAGRRPAGAWSGAPRAETAGSLPMSGRDAGEAPAASKAPSDSLEDYFDRLDAAFSSAGVGGPAGPAGPTRDAVEKPARAASPGLAAASPAAEPASEPVDDFAAWKQSLDAESAGDTDSGGSSTTAAEPAAAAVQPPSPSGQEPASAPGEPSTWSSMPPLSEAFAALLSAEQRYPVSGSSFGVQPVPEATIDDIVRRVIDQMSSDTVRRTVIDVAERLVREEIERIKQSR